MTDERVLTCESSSDRGSGIESSSKRLGWSMLVV